MRPALSPRHLALRFADTATFGQPANGVGVRSEAMINGEGAPPRRVRAASPSTLTILKEVAHAPSARSETHRQPGHLPRRAGGARCAYGRGPRYVRRSPHRRAFRTDRGLRIAPAS